MNTISLNNTKNPRLLVALSKNLPGTIEKVHDFHILYIAPSIGKGSIRYLNLQKGLKVLDFEITLKETVEIPINPVSTETMQFLYCLEGSCIHKFENEAADSRIEQFQTAVMHSNKDLYSSIIIQKDQKLVLNMLLVDKEEYFNKFVDDSNHFDQKLKDLLSDIGSKSKHFHSGKFNLQIAEQLKLLTGLEHANEIAEALSQKGRYYLVLAKQIEQFCAEVNDNVNTSGLLKSELQQITQASDFIKNHPEMQHTIKSLCNHAGLSPAKLQEGFKFMFGRTVSDFVRNIRLEKAEHLIKTTDLTISEIVYTIGLTSRSYFCKVFKQKYRLSPKEYKNHIQKSDRSIIEN